MVFVNQRWPRDICPQSCVFGRTRNDFRQESARTRKATVIRQGRPLYRAECTWALPRTQRLAKLRYWLEQLDGYNGSVQIWDFANPFPFGLELATGPTGLGVTRTLWTNTGATSYWTFNGEISHWAVGATVTTTANAALGATTLALQGLQANRQAVVQGQYVQVGRRIYLAATNVTSSPTGTATITLDSPLLAAAPIGTVVRLAEAACEMQLINQNIDSTSRAGDGLTVVSASFIESVEDVP